MKAITVRAWAISTGNPGLIGAYWFESTIPAWRMGFRYATFLSRAVAREHMKKVRGPASRGVFPNARVVRVEVRVTCKKIA